MLFLPKQDSFQDSSINHLRCLRNFLFPFILASFSKINDFTIDFFAKEVVLITFFFPELIFSGNSADSGEEKVIRATSFAKKSIMKSSNLEKLAKLRRKRAILKY